MSNLSFRSHKLSVTALHFIYTHYEFLYAHGRSGPQWAALASVTAWLEAAAHVIFSLQLGLGVLTTYGGYNKFGHSLVRDSCIIIFGHFCWVILSVLLVFSLRGVADSAGILQLPAPAAESVWPNSSAVARAVSVSVLGESVGMSTVVLALETLATLQHFPVSFRGIMPSNIDQKKSRDKAKKKDLDTMLNSLADYVYITKIYVLIFK